MKGQLFKAIYACEEENQWALLETDKGFYELRVGGIKRTDESRDERCIIELPVKNRSIRRVMTDDFAVFLELEDDTLVMHADTFVNDQGLTSFEVHYLDTAEFTEAKADWYGIELPLVEIHG